MMIAPDSVTKCFKLLVSLYLLKSAEKAIGIERVDTLTYPNRKQHNTYDYDQEDLILRRGQQFKIDLICDRDIDAENDAITIQYAYGIFHLLFNDFNFKFLYKFLGMSL